VLRPGPPLDLLGTRPPRGWRSTTGCRGSPRPRRSCGRRTGSWVPGPISPPAAFACV